MKDFFHKTFSSLKIKNYRLYYFGQLVSLSGTFLQALAQDWLVLKLTDSGLLLGLVSACQFLPMLILMPWGGVIADRFPKLKLLFATQSILGILSLVLGILVLTGSIHVWMVFVFAICLGLTNSLDYPTRQAFVYELVGKDEIKNAVSVWTILISITRIIGPAIAGILIATVGIGQCFIINAISYIAVLVVFLLINTKHLHTSALVAATKGQIREGFNYILKTPVLFNSLTLMAVVGTLTFEWQASMPLFARFILHGDALTYSAITVALSIGMLVGGLYTARTGHVTQKRLVWAAFLLGVFTIIASFATTLIFALITFAFVGLFMIMFANLSNSLLQINTDQKMRGRIMSFWNMAFQGSTAVGGPLIGGIGQLYGAQWSLAVGGIAALVAGGYGFIVLRRKII
jgi:MFS family permease